MDEGRRQPEPAPLRGSGEALDVLPTTTWTVLHDVPWPGCAGATIDHVAVGPSGVYVIDAHGDSGCDAGRPAQAASAVAPAVAAITCQRPVAVLCLARRAGVAGWAGDVLVCSTANVDRMLRARTTILTPVQVEEAVQVLAGGGRVDDRASAAPTARAAPGAHAVHAAHAPQTAQAAQAAQAATPTTAPAPDRPVHRGRRRWWRGSLASTAAMAVAGGTGHRST